MSATLHRGDRMQLIDPRGVRFLVSETAELECGCKALIGLRLDKEDARGNFEPSVAGIGCSSDHEGLIEHFNFLLRESLADPSDRLLSVAVVDILEEAQRNWRPA